MRTNALSEILRPLIARLPTAWVTATTLLIWAAAVVAKHMGYLTPDQAGALYDVLGPATGLTLLFRDEKQQLRINETKDHVGLDRPPTE